MNRCVGIVQARMGSTRLPGKVLADIGGAPLLERLLRRLERCERLDGVVVATSVNPADDPVETLGRRLGFGVHRGDEADVLGRVLGAAEAAGADVVVRITGDCPLIDPGVVDECIALREKTGCDYASNVNVRTYPDGLDTEVIHIDALRRTETEAHHPELREHVTPYIRGVSPDLPSGDFDRRDLTYPSDFGHIRWTVDRAGDLERVREIFTALTEPFSWLDALSLATRHPHLLGLVRS